MKWGLGILILSLAACSGQAPVKTVNTNRNAKSTLTALQKKYSRLQLVCGYTIEIKTATDDRTTENRKVLWDLLSPTDVVQTNAVKSVDMVEDVDAQTKFELHMKLSLGSPLNTLYYQEDESGQTHAYKLKNAAVLTGSGQIQLKHKDAQGNLTPFASYDSSSLRFVDRMPNMIWRNSTASGTTTRVICTVDGDVQTGYEADLQAGTGSSGTATTPPPVVAPPPTQRVPPPPASRTPQPGGQTPPPITPTPPRGR